MKLGIALVSLSLSLWASNAHAEIELTRVVIVGQRAGDVGWTSRPTEAREADRPRLAVVAVARELRGNKRRTVYIADDTVRPLMIGRKKIRERAIRSWAQLGAKKITTRWLTIEPHAWRQTDEAAPNGNDRRFHSNVSMAAGSFGKWLGYDRIEYFATAIGPAKAGAASRIRAAAIIASDPEVKGKTRLGTIRYQVEVDVDGTRHATPGIEAVDRAGILPSVHRVSIRSDDSFVGHLTAFFLVPEVFGSAGSGRNHQTERFTGADCADVLTGAARRSGLRHIKYSNVAGMTRYARTIAGPIDLDARGTPGETISGIQRGDIIRINYGGSLAGHTPRSWDHVAVVFEDKSDPEGPHKGAADGELDGFDIVAHMGHPRVVLEPLRSQAPATIDVLRWKKK